MNTNFKTTAAFMLNKLKSVEIRGWITFSVLAIIIFGFSENAWAVHDIFGNPASKATFLQTGLISFGKILVGVLFVLCSLGALAGRVNWKWVLTIGGIAVALVTIQKISDFMLAETITPVATQQR